MHEYETKIQNRVKFMEREQNKYLNKIQQTRKDASRMQEIREAKERAFSQLAIAKEQKEHEEQKHRNIIDNKREALQRRKLE